jgi:hypothetical protein
VGGKWYASGAFVGSALLDNVLSSLAASMIPIEEHLKESE